MTSFPVTVVKSFVWLAVFTSNCYLQVLLYWIHGSYLADRIEETGNTKKGRKSGKRLLKTRDVVAALMETVDMT